MANVEQMARGSCEVDGYSKVNVSAPHGTDQPDRRNGRGRDSRQETRAEAQLAGVAFLLFTSFLQESDT
jgi:hypothetical protein